MIRNPKPLYITLFIAAVLSFLLASSNYMMNNNTNQALTILIVTFIASFLLFFYSIEYFIYRKIKLIYKTIHSLKTQKYDAQLSKYSL
ncbi:MAG: sensor histidine kinase, partial [Bacteroidia bacterium]